MKFVTKPIQHYPPQLRHVATLPWEIKCRMGFVANLAVFLISVKI